MSAIMLVHISTGTLAILAATVALLAPKGRPVHRVAGAVFTLTMLMMAVAGAWIAFVKPMLISVVAGLFTLYLVATGWMTVRIASHHQRIATGVAALCALAVGGLSGWGALTAMGSPEGTVDEFGPAPYAFFAGLSLLGAALDGHATVRGGLAGVHRIARHLWRMCLAFFIAAGSLFTGPGATAFPEPIRESGVLSLPEPAILLAMLAALVLTYRSARKRV
ncbi:DUF2306 domain-containing protein [bacterium]|nr:DUF2306 domain-containing protein [bacterium]